MPITYPNPSPTTGYVGRRSDPVPEGAAGESVFVIASAPTSATKAGEAHPGTVLVNRSTGHVYRNDGTLSTPSWTDLGEHPGLAANFLDARDTALRSRLLALAAGEH
jgi:hypothetical protein